jgi:hypothetical protein
MLDEFSHSTKSSYHHFTSNGKGLGFDDEELTLQFHQSLQTLLVAALVKLLESEFHHKVVHHALADRDDDSDFVFKVPKLVLVEFHHTLDADTDAALIFHHRLVVLEVHNRFVDHTLDADIEADLVVQFHIVALLELHNVAALP